MVFIKNHGACVGEGLGPWAIVLTYTKSVKFEDSLKLYQSIKL